MLRTARKRHEILTSNKRRDKIINRNLSNDNMKLHDRDSNRTLKHIKRVCKDIEEQRSRSFSTLHQLDHSWNFLHNCGRL